jgi:hypothetical protein
VKDGSKAGKNYTADFDAGSYLQDSLQQIA